VNAIRHVAAAGARSQIGVFLLPLLGAAGYRVTALSRQENPPASLGGPVAWCSPQTAPSAIDGLVSCGPLSLARRWVEHSEGLDRVVAFSTTSTVSKKNSGDRSERNLVRSIAGEETALKALCRERGIALSILRPTLVYGCGQDHNLSRLLRFGERTGFIPCSSRAGGLRQPVHAEDLATIALAALGRPGNDFSESPVCGGSTLTYREMLEKTSRCGRRPIRLVSIAPALMVPVVKAAAMTGLASGVNPEMVRRQATDLVFDDTPAREFLGWNPRPFDPTPADFELPPALKRELST
jgi:nucleoside-diphosphate-sugar epimerase